MKRVSTKDMSREQWLEARKAGIGGSDISAIMGKNPWKSAYELYFDKLGILEEKETTEAMRIGTDLEQYVAERYMEATGKKIQRTNFMYFDDEYDFMVANIDREIVGENAAVECKTTNIFSTVDYDSGDVPIQYYMQCQWYMMVRGYDYIDLAVLVFGKGFFYSMIERDEEFIADMRKAAIEFWNNNVLEQTPPEPDGSDSSLKVLKQLYPMGDDKKEIILPGSADALLSTYTDYADSIKRMEKAQDEIKAQILSTMEDAAIARGDHWQVTYKNQERTSVDSKALKEKFPEIYGQVTKTSSFRVFRMKKI